MRIQEHVHYTVQWNYAYDDFDLSCNGTLPFSYNCIMFYFSLSWFILLRLTSWLVQGFISFISNIIFRPAIWHSYLDFKKYFLSVIVFCPTYHFTVFLQSFSFEYTRLENACFKRNKSNQTHRTVSFTLKKNIFIFVYKRKGNFAAVYFLRYRCTFRK